MFQLSTPRKTQKTITVFYNWTRTHNHIVHKQHSTIWPNLHAYVTWQEHTVSFLQFFRSNKLEHWLKMVLCTRTLFENIVFHAMLLLLENGTVSNKVWGWFFHWKSQIRWGVVISRNGRYIFPKFEFKPTLLSGTWEYICNTNSLFQKFHLPAETVLNSI